MTLFRLLTEFHSGARHGDLSHPGVGALSLVGQDWADGCRAFRTARAACRWP